MAKQVTINSEHAGRQGFYITEKDKQERVWIPAGKSHLDEDVYDRLLKTSEAFKAEVESARIIIYTAKQERKVEDKVAKLEKEKAEMQAQIDKLQGQVNHFTKRSKPGPKPQGN